MTPADEVGFDNQLEEQLRAVVKEVSLQPRLVEDLHSSEDVQTLLSRHLDQEASERRAIYYRLQAIESAIKRRRSRGIVRYLVAIGIGCCSHAGLAIVRRNDQADNRDKGSGTWLVTGDQADDHRLDAAAWLDEATVALSYRDAL